MKQLRYADLLQEKVDGNLTRNDEALLDVVVDQLALVGIPPFVSLKRGFTGPFPCVELRFLPHSRTRSTPQENNLRFLLVHLFLLLGCFLGLLLGLLLAFVLALLHFSI